MSRCGRTYRCTSFTALFGTALYQAGLYVGVVSPPPYVPVPVEVQKPYEYEYHGTVVMSREAVKPHYCHCVRDVCCFLASLLCCRIVPLACRTDMRRLHTALQRYAWGKRGSDSKVAQLKKVKTVRTAVFMDGCLRSLGLPRRN